MSPLRLLIGLGLACVGVAASAHPTPTGRDEAPATDLQPKTVVEGRIGGGEVDRWAVELSEDEAFTVRLDQLGQDLMLSVTLPGQDEDIGVNWIESSQGAERFFGVAESPGTAGIEVRTFQATATEGGYRLKVELHGPVTPEWRSRAVASRLLEGTQLEDQELEPEERERVRGRVERALALWRDIEDPEAELRTLRRLGLLRDQQGEKTEAVELLGQALAIGEAAGDELGVAAVLEARGTTLDEMGRPEEAVADLERSLGIYEEHDDTRGQVLALGALASAIDKQGDKDRALELYEETLELNRRVGDRMAEGVQLINMGRVYSLRGETDRATAHYQRALGIWEETGKRSFAGWTLHNLGAVQEKRGEPAAALDYYGRAMEVWEEIGDLRGKSYSLHNMGVVHDTLGESQRALELYENALELFRKLGLLRGQAQLLQNLGRIHGELGHGTRALELFIESLDLARQAGWRPGEAKALRRIGRRYTLQGDLDRAEEHLAQARSLYVELKMTSELGTTLADLGFVALERGELERALELGREAVELWLASENRKQAGDGHRLLGEVHLERGELEAAGAELKTALDLARTTGDLGGEAQSLYDLAKLARKRGELEEALVQAEAALDRVEVLRSKVGSPRLRATFLGERETYFAFLMDVLMELDGRNPGAGHAERAFQVSERARARSFLDLVAEMREELYVEVPAELRRREEELRRRIVVGHHRLLQTQSRGSEAEQQEAGARLEKLLDELERVEGEIRGSSPRFAALTRPDIPSPRALRGLLEEAETIVLEYFLGRDRGYLFVLSAKDLEVHRLRGRGELDPMLDELRSLLSEGGHGLLAAPRVERLAMELGEELLGEVEHLDEVRRFVVVPHGPLHYLPFAMLGRPGRGVYEPLVARDQVEIVTVPSAAVLRELRDRGQGRARAEGALAVLADPVFSHEDPRVSGEPRREASGTACEECGESLRAFRAARGFDLKRLTSSRREAELITEPLKGERVLQALGFEADLELVVEGGLRPYRVIHFATHGLLNDAHPELSSLVLSLVDEAGNERPGFLLPHHIFGSRLEADLVVLSACNTALGEEIRGEGLVGLTRAFLHAGVGGVVASLWRVEDRSTTLLMEHLYRALIREGRSAPAALAEAQRALLRTGAAGSPREWAGFVFQGDWQSVPFP